MRVSNSLDPDQSQCFVGPDLGPNCLQRLSADDLSRQRVNIFVTEQNHPYNWMHQSWDTHDHRLQLNSAFWINFQKY